MNFKEMINIIIVLSILHTGYESTTMLYKVNKLNAVCTALIYILCCIAIIKGIV